MKENKKFLIAFPVELVKNYYSSDERIIFIDNKSISFVVNGNRKSISHSSQSDNLKNISGFDYDNILNKVKDYLPVWSRWVDKGDQYQQYFRKAIFETQKIYSIINELNICGAVFLTSVSHHLDSLILEMACSEADIPQFFLYNLYSSEFGGRYGRTLVFRQERDLKDRSVIKNRVSNYKYDEDLKKILSYARKRNSNPAVFNFRTSFYYYTFLSLFFDKLKFFTKKTLQLIGIIKRTENEIGSFPNYSLITHIKQIKYQKKGLEYYKKNIVSKKELEEYKNSKNILIAAHFQPEATSFPEGGKLNNHIDIVYEIRKKGFEGVIFYKEHPASFLYKDTYAGPTRVGFCRSVEYYKHLESLGCIFLDTNMNLSMDEDENDWYIPVTITGSIALERSMEGLHTIISGHPWYKGLPGSINLQDLKSLKDINNDWLTINSEIKKKSFDYLKNLLNDKTIMNAIGVSTGINDKNQKLDEIFLKEFNKLLDHIN